MLGSPAGPGGPSQRGLWPLAPAPTATSFTAEGIAKYGGVYSLFPGGQGFGNTLYSQGRLTSSHLGNTFHSTHKVCDSLFSCANYTFGAPTPPPGSPYSPIPATPLELLAKGFNSSIIIQQPDYPTSPKKILIQEKHCDEKCCSSSVKPQKQCSCSLGSPVKTHKYCNENINGCSRTNPPDWAGANVKKEPGATPCQVAEITTSVSPVVKLEVTSPTQKNVDGHGGMLGGSVLGANGHNIPVGIAVARQRVQEIISSPSLPPAGLLTTVTSAAQLKEMSSRISEIDSTASVGSMAANAAGGVTPGGPLLHCTDDRAAGLAAWPMGGGHSQALATPTLWQYPAPFPLEPMVPLPVPMPPVGFQLVRDPTTAGLLLLPTTGIESLQQAVVWPSYAQPPSVLLPSLPPLPPPPLQLLSSSSSDYLASSTTLHQHTQTHSTRLVAVTTDTKRKIPLPIPATTLIKIETDANSVDQTKNLQTLSTISNNTGTVFTDPTMTPMVTTHVIYQHPTNLILSQAPSTETACRSQATSPVSCLTPPPDIIQNHEEPATFAVQDAGNQTETPIYSEDDNTTHMISDVGTDSKVKPSDECLETNCNEAEGSLIKTLVPEIVKEAPTKVIEPEPMEEPSTTVEEVQEKPLELKTVAPDISGLELLSNSIVVYENERNNLNNNEVQDNVKNEVSANSEKVTEVCSKVDDSLGGLDLLCALAEQRILEENVVKKEKERSKERRREKRKSKKHSSDEPRRKKMKSDKHYSENRHREHRKRDKYISDKSDTDKEKRLCSCRVDDNYHSYKTPESEEGVKKFIASKTQSICCKTDWPYMNAMEIDMRKKLAELQRQYREKQKELSKLKPKKHSQECSKKQSRKKSTHSDRSSLTPPPLLDKMDVPIKPNKHVAELLTPPTLCAMPKIDETYNKTQSDVESSPEKTSASKKRKVGRPKKLLSSSGLHVATETIVAKKPKSSLVGYFLAAKEKLQLQNKIYSESPPRYLEEQPHKTRRNKNNNNIIVADVRSSKMRPKLKAEATLKSYTEEEHWDEFEDHIEEEDFNEVEEVSEEPLVEQIMEVKTESEAEEEEEQEERTETEIVEEVKPEDTRCTLTAEHLEKEKLRVLTAMGGLFYAGHLNAVEPPDVYSISLDGERGNRPHIMSREEILRDAIVEVSPKSPEDLPVSTRVCAYWSQQYRCLYPGSVAEPGTPHPDLDDKFVSVEFDDGDSGRIALEDIRFLPPDYPIIEYDPNPLGTLSRRRRRTSTNVSTEERRPHIDSPKEPTGKENTNICGETQTDDYKKKRIKKKKREKQKEKLDERKKRKKHKCAEDDVCKHKKHKKHKKRKRHHEKTRESDESLDNSVEGETTDSFEEEQKKLQEEVEEKQQENEVEEVTRDKMEEEAETEDSNEAMEVEPDANAEDEVTMDDIIEAGQSNKSKRLRARQESSESRSKMSAFLPARQMWGWHGTAYKRQRAKTKSWKSFYRTIQRGKETISLGDQAVFLSTSHDRPYIGRIESLWEVTGTMWVKVKWFYHPEETIGCPTNLQYPGALFASEHVDDNEVQTISHKCEVLPLKDYKQRLGNDPQSYETIYENNDVYYLAGAYDPTTLTLKMKPEIPFKSDK